MDDSLLMDALDRRVKRRQERREFFRVAGGFAAGAAGAVALTACGGGSDNNSSTGSTAVAQSAAPTDADVLNFALNLEYLEASFYSFAVNGVGLPASSQTGTGTQGTVTGGAKVNFTNPLVSAYAKEIAGDEINHVNFLRSALGGAAVALPSIDISGTDPNGAFSAAAQAAGVVAAGQVFNPYADDVSFLLGAFIFEDVGVTAYKGASPLLTNKTYLEAAAGILAVEAYHAGIIRTTLYSLGIQTPSANIAATVGKISDARDSLDGSTDDDQGIVNADGTANLVPTDGNSIAFSRTTGQVLNVVYLTKAAATKGGFFPNGVNGLVNASTAEA